MKATLKISRRDVMNRAWRIYRSGRYSADFGDCLRRAWWVEKENAVYRVKKAEEERWASIWREGYERNENTPAAIDMELKAAVMETYYRSGAYSGD
jgi:hypothetical protein